VHCVGPSISPRRGDQDIAFPWEWLDGRPLVSLSLGSIFLGDRSFYARAAQASDGQPWQIVIRLGPHVAPPRSPANVLFVREQPQLALLRRASAMVSHGGVNSCVEALAAGVPLVLAPGEVDQADFAERVVRAGAGLRVERRTARAEQIRDALRRVLEEPAFRERAGRVAADFARCDAPRVSAALIERLAETRQPVLRAPGSTPTVYAAELNR
jgi:MGT family glycosyltransferase